MFIAPLPDKLATILPALGIISGLSVRNIFDRCFALSFPLSRGKVGSKEEYQLGGFGEDVETVVRLTRDKVYWIFPTVSSILPSHIDTQLLLVRLKGGEVVALLPFTTPDYVGSFRGLSSGSGISVLFERDTSTRISAEVAVAFGTDIEQVIAHVVRAVRVTRSGSSAVSPIDGERQIFSDSMTYCTWNSLQPPIVPTATNALKTLKTFTDSNIRPRSFLIDDAWQDVFNFRLQSFDSKLDFLDGRKDLGELVSTARKEYSVKEVGAWHTIQGYWCGIEPTLFVDKYKLIKVTKDGYPGPFEPEGFAYYIVHPLDIGRFFDDYYAVLKSHGITFTKCDNMASLDNLVTAREVASITADGETLGPTVDVPSIRVAYKEAVKSAAQKHFGSSTRGRVIWCMEMTPRVLLGEEIGLTTGSTERHVLRNSDDYYPDEPDSHRYHIFINVVNAMFTSQLNVVPDLDMFQSHPYIRPHKDGDAPQAVQDSDNYPQAAFHAALRSFGAGPVTMTDVAGKTDPEIVNRLIGSTTNASPSIALHASSSPFLSNDIFDQTLVLDGVGKALRVFSRVSGGLEGGMVGYWNIRSKDGKVEDQVTLADVLRLSMAQSLGRYIVYSRKMDDVRLIQKTDASITPSLPINLLPFEFELLAVAPTVQGDGIEVAALGLIDKYNTLAGLISFEAADGGKEWTARVKCSGVVAFWVQSTTPLGPPRISVDGKEAKADIRSVQAGSIVSLPLEPFVEGRTTDEPFTVHLFFGSN